ncbi:hypothetical protein PRIPAC_72928 [Pristionchus pacificus]|uniref:Uncharacterized protein n=1 Tax=Pristionchus pacificus TaxID=54126 RepID=A0A2A6CRT7_PRIPA|nr:hypothetical protein PRIPAC_72928 [Pristionchus pacificus]|eukprot:PDM80915.1 hypothetical protein PRIPAC_35918 [Pristionchus pacificus]
MRLLLPLLLLLPPLISCAITFSVEEPPLHPKGQAHRHHRRHNHGRDHQVAAPEPPKRERFSLNCPHVADADNKDVHIEVTWTLDDTVLLKIRDGHPIVLFNKTSFYKKTFKDKHVVHVELSGRYMFNYDELTGDFMMEINEVQPFDDFGSWQCHITRKRGHESISESTRKTIVAPPGAVERRAAAAKEAAKEKARPQTTTPGFRIAEGSGSHHAYPKARIDYGSDGEEYQTRTTQKFSAFTRPDQNSVQISRDSTDRRRQTVVFDRSVTKDYRQHSIDYELSMADDENDDFRYEGYSKRARAAAIGANGASAGPLSMLLLAVTVAVMYTARL